MDSCVECGVDVATISDTPICSKDCRESFARSTWETVSGEFRCHICFKSFSSVQPLVSHINGSSAYHSGVCISKHDIPALAEECEWCGEKFFPKNRANSVNRFCCKGCEGKARRNDALDPRRTQEYKEWSESQRNKFGKCVDCGSEDNLHVHHIASVSDNPGLCMDEDNIVVVCNLCHAKRHDDNPNVSAMLRSM